MSNDEENKKEEFDPTESDAFYDNLRAVLNLDEEEEPEEMMQEEPEQEVSEEPAEAEGTEDTEELPELVFAKDLFEATDEELADMASAQDELDSAEEAAEEEPEVDEDLFLGVDAALTEQIESEFGTTTTKSGFGWKILSVLKKVPLWTKILTSVILVILLSVGFLFGTKPGRVLFSNVASKIIFSFIHTVPDPSPTPTPDGRLTPKPTDVVILTPGASPTVNPYPTEGADVTQGPTLPPTNSPTPTPTVVPIMDDPDVINILLLGVENIFGAKYGRSDAILIGSVNKKTGELKLVSLLRDTYVRLPNGEGSKLNGAYSKGGANMIMDTIEANFRIDIDNYATINFTGFENLIDELGGVGVSLTIEESDYLNSTRYISNPEERNTVPGYQVLTGSQALGYCRVRDTNVPTANGLRDDFGRTYRQRTVLKAIFDKFKEKNYVELLGVMRKCFYHVTAPESLQKQAADCLNVVLEHKILDFETLRIPASGKWTAEDINGMDVLYPSPDNIEILQKFLYGEDAR